MTSPPESRGVQRLSVLLLACALFGSVWLVRRATPPERSRRGEVDLMRVVPAGASVLLTVDVEALGAGAARELLQAGAGGLLGLREPCGFEPLLGLRNLMVALPPSAASASPDFALIASTTLSQEPVLRCAEAVIRKRGGTPMRSSLGEFQSVRDRAKPLGEVAIRADGLFVLSGGQYFRDVVDAASGVQVGDEAARVRSASHVAVRRKLAQSQLVLSALPGPLLPLPGVRALGFGLEVQGDVQLRGVLRCEAAADCGAARELLRGALAEAAKQPELSGLASVELVQRSAELHISGRFARQQLGPLLSQLLP